MINFILASYKYLLVLIRHRSALAKAAKKLNVPMARVLRHDNSKFSWLEWRAYVRKLVLKIDDDQEWAAAWEHHWQSNDHHIEYWEDRGMIFSWTGEIRLKDWPHAFTHYPKAVGTCGVAIPDVAVREIIADWMAASYAYSGSWPVAPVWGWGNKNLVSALKRMEHTMQPETSTRGFAISLLHEHNMITKEQMNDALEWEDCRTATTKQGEE